MALGLNSKQLLIFDSIKQGNWRDYPVQRYKKSDKSIVKDQRIANMLRFGKTPTEIKEKLGTTLTRIEHIKRCMIGGEEI